MESRQPRFAICNGLSADNRWSDIADLHHAWILRSDHTYESDLLWTGAGHGGQFTFSDVRILGVLEIILGLGAFAFPSVEIGLILWATGFGLLHIIYGIVMYLKYDRGRAR